MAIMMGIDIGQKRDLSAICVAETQTRADGEQSMVHHLIRHLDRLPVGTPFPEVAKRVAAVALSVEHHVDDSPLIFVDATGLGQPIMDLLEEAVSRARTVTPVYSNHGDRRAEMASGWRTEVQLGKAYLVSRLQALLQTRRLQLPRTAQSETLARELQEYEIQVAEDANDRYGAFRVGTHDDLVTALGLAVQCDPIGPGIY